MVGSQATIIIGLTGGVGSGKSTVERLCCERGIPTADADRWAHEILEHDDAVQQQIVTYFQKIYRHSPLLPDGNVDRAYIASKAFNEPRTLAFIENLIHPRVKDLAEQWISEQREREVPVAVMVVPLLLESGMDAQCDIVVALAVPEKIRTERLAVDRGWTREECRARIRHQLDEKNRCTRADTILANEGTPAELAASLDKLLQNVGSLLSRKNRNMNQ